MAEQTNRQPEIMITQILEEIISATHGLPREQDLHVIISDASTASERGYYLPDEDERLRTVYSDYLRIRAILLDLIQQLQPLSYPRKNWNHDLEAFSIAYTAACALIRAASYVINAAKTNKVIWNKLDEGETRFGLKRKSLTRLYKSATSPSRMWRFHEATRFYESKKSEILSLRNKSSLHNELITLLEEEEPFIEAKRRAFLKKRLKYRVYDFIRRHKSSYSWAMFHLFRISGSAIADMRYPVRQLSSKSNGGKRVTQPAIERLKQLLRPGDILVTRHDDALSNLFLPGFWPHAAFYIGEDEQGMSVVESKKDGVKLRALEETLSVDSFLVMRSDLNENSITEGIKKAKTHIGKRYDFLFDFTKANRLACTELVYRSFHSIDGIHFKLEERSGRKCMSAEDLIDQAMASGRFRCIAIYGVQQNNFHVEDEARDILKHSYNSNWI